MGVDCPFGWPTAFVQLVHDHELGQLAAPPSSGRDWRRGLTMRLTDQHVHQVTGLTPLSWIHVPTVPLDVLIRSP